jgi:Ca2+/H+ antiporter
LVIAGYGLGLLFSPRTHREIFGDADHEDAGEAPWPIGLALAMLAGVTVLVALVSEVFVESAGGGSLRDDPCIRGFHRRSPVLLNKN